MKGINPGRVMSGGLCAGVLLALGETLLNQAVSAKYWAALSMGQTASSYAIWKSAAMIGVLILYGVVLIWIYAAIRPRFGPGPRTAIIAGLTLWAIGWGLLGVSLSVAGTITPRIAMFSAIWGIVEVPVAALAGAWIYRECPQGSAMGQAE
jgi:hypothetical protein